MTEQELDEMCSEALADAVNSGSPPSLFFCPVMACESPKVYEAHRQRKLKAELRSWGILAARDREWLHDALLSRKPFGVAE